MLRGNSAVRFAASWEG